MGPVASAGGQAVATTVEKLSPAQLQAIAEAKAKAAAKYVLLAVLGLILITLGLWALIGTERIVQGGKDAARAAAA
jgi:hypothetical protein